jgi:hypothetical protein
MTVYRGDNQDPAFLEKIRKLPALLLLSFQSLADGPPLAPCVTERDVTYRPETDDSIMFSDLKKGVN